MNPLKTTTIEVLDRILPDRIKNSIFHLAFHLARAEFERFAYEYSFAPHMQFGLPPWEARLFSKDDH